MIALPACGGDPVLEAAREEAASSTSTEGAGGATRPAEPRPGQPDQPVPPGDPGQPGAGIPEEPKPGDPNTPPPEGGVKPHDDGTIPPPEGSETIVLSGTLVIDDYQGGKITIDVFDGDQTLKGDKRPDIVGRATFDGPGPFEMVVLADTPIWLSAYADQDENGRPSKEDPMGPCECNPVKSDEDVSGVEFVMNRGTPPGG
ncbi:MAG: hypothetical protein GY913_03765 [Proteobacteria bacterium]|nr:hypothetical protein [Pseudomonadota bacterium]